MGKLINIGYGNSVAFERVVAVIAPSSLPIKRLREEARRLNKLIDATAGRQTRSVIVTDSDHIILSSVRPSTIVSRLKKDKEELRTRADVPD